MLVLVSISAAAQEPSAEIARAGTATKLKMGADVVPVAMGHPIHLVDPMLSKSQRKKNLITVLFATIAADGSFENLAIAAGDPDFAVSAVKAVREWRYTPATRGGEPGAVKVSVIIRSDRGKLKATVEPELPVQTEPLTTDGGDSSESAFKVGGGISAPKAISAPSPEYSETARLAKYQGVVELGMVVGADGNPKDVWVKKKIGLGLDQKAIQAARVWRFQPAMKDGKPVAVLISIEMTFRVY